MEWGPWLVTFIAGQATGLATALVVAWVETRLRRQEIRAAEKRVRKEERFELVRRYASGLQEFVHEAAGLIVVGKRSWRDEGWGSAPDTLERELTKRWDNAQALRPHPGPSYILRDQAALEQLIVLELEANGCRLKCLECLSLGGPMADEMANGFVEGAGNAVDKLFKRMDELVERLEP